MKTKIAKKKKLPENNVVSIMTNSKFKLNNQVQLVTTIPGEHIKYIQITSNEFGFAADDLIFYRTFFDFSEISEDTLCVVDAPDRFLLVQNPAPGPKVLGIVECFQRRISND
jgi:hypothetical protein